MKDINVLSLCDGMSCGHIALKELGITVKNYYASEIDKNAIKVTQSNFPDTIQLGDLTSIDDTILKTLPKIDLVIFGSPCRSLSRASMGNHNGGVYHHTGLQGISGLFINCVDILKWIKLNNNPNVYFLSENVVSYTHKDDIDTMSKLIGVEPILLNSSWFSAQDRERNYWTNIPLGSLPKENTQVLKDILDKNVDDKFYYDCDFELHSNTKRTIATLEIKGIKQMRRVMNPNFKSYTVCSCRGGNTQNKVYDESRNKCRKLTPHEYRVLQTIPEWYEMDIANGHIYNMCGDGWNIETIKYIFSELKNL